MQTETIEAVFINAVNNHQNHHTELAEEGYLTCMESEYKIFDCLHNLGLLYTETENFQKAEYVYLQMIEMKRDHMDAYFNLGNIYSNLGYTENAIKIYEMAREANPYFVNIYNNLGILYKNADKYAEAFSAYKSGLLIEPKNEALHHNLSNLIRGNPLPSDQMKLESTETLLIELLSFSNNEFQDFTIPIMGFLFDKYALNGRDFDNSNGYLLLDNPLFQLTLRTTLITSFYLEHFLVNVRKSFLFSIFDDNLKNEKLQQQQTFIYSLAIQCFWTEYVYIIDENEERLLDQLDLLITDAVARNDTIAIVYIGVYGCYRPLISKTYIDNDFILLEQENRAIFKELYRILIKEPIEEKRLKKSLLILNPINDELSQKVAQQYEENPYPRWVSVRKHQSRPLTHFLKMQLPLITEINSRYSVEDQIDILIAGSGTGKHPIERLQLISHSHVTGVDLSSSSLTYALRKATELNLTNINFIQGNILDLKLLGKKFDLIESVGVLHHMQDPLKGWKVLTDILKSNGFMKIGLYSDLARKSVVETISFIGEKRYKPELTDIRKCRDEIYHLNTASSLWNLTDYTDFYSVSGTRDLIFNIQEHRFTIPQIETSLKILGLEFLGFSFADKTIYQRYLEMFPEDKEGIVLKNWHEFEIKNPDTFIQMYQFWLQKQ